MQTTVPLAEGFSLRISDEARTDGRYPTRRLQKGLILLHEGRELADEGVGFGVPVVKRGVQTIFPGGITLATRRDGAAWLVTAAFEMNLVERLASARGARVRPRWLYAARDSLAALHRRAPALRGLLTATSVTLRRTFGWVTAFEECASCGVLRVTYGVHPEEGVVDVAVDTTGLRTEGVTEVVLMNELGAHCFDRYADSEGIALHGDEIGTWDTVTAARASFVSDSHGVAFSLGQAENATLKRGCELVGARLAWAGFGYCLPATVKAFTYRVSIERVP
jgi:hypothetical protein